MKIKGGTKREDKPPTKGQHSKSQINRWDPKIKQHGLIKRDFDSKKKIRMVLVPHLNRIGNLVFGLIIHKSNYGFNFFFKKSWFNFGLNSTYNKIREPNYGSSLLKS